MSNFNDEDFTVLLLYAGLPPTFDRHHVLPGWPSLTQRVDYIDMCNVFCEEYFDKKYPLLRWLDFFEEFNTWLHNQQDTKE